MFYSRAPHTNPFIWSYGCRFFFSLVSASNSVLLVNFFFSLSFSFSFISCIKERAACRGWLVYGCFGMTFFVVGRSVGWLVCCCYFCQKHFFPTCFVSFGTTALGQHPNCLMSIKYILLMYRLCNGAKGKSNSTSTEQVSARPSTIIFISLYERLFDVMA